MSEVTVMLATGEELVISCKKKFKAETELLTHAKSAIAHESTVTLTGE